MLQTRTGKQSHERGVALILAIFSLMLLSAAGIGLLFMSDTDTAIQANYRDEQVAYFAARAGLEEVRQRLMPEAADLNGPQAAPATGSGVMYVLNPNDVDGTINPWDASSSSPTAYPDRQICNEGFTSFACTETSRMPSATTGFTSIASKDPGTGTSRAMRYKWVRITAKTNNASHPYCVDGDCTNTGSEVMCWDGTQQIKLPPGLTTCEGNNPATPTGLTTVWKLTSLAVAPGGTRRMMQMETARMVPVITNAAVDSKDHVTLNGKLSVNGYDYCSCDCTKNGTGTMTCVSRPGKTCDSTRWGIYSHSTVDNPNSSEEIYSSHNPPYAQNQPWNYNIDGLISKYKGLPEAVNVTDPAGPYKFICTASTSSSDPNANCGNIQGSNGTSFGVPPYFPPSTNEVLVPGVDGPNNMNYQITYVPGSIKVTAGVSGYGILMVDGDLEIHGDFNFYGLVLVSGVVTFSGGGNSKVNIYGAVLAGKKSIDQTTDVDTLGGGAAINYNLCALKDHMPKGSPTIISVRELMF